jgi:hypothetical protein
VTGPAAPPPAPTGRLVVATAVALAAAAVLLVVAVLPYEYGIDPTGIGDRLGLTAPAEQGVILTPLAEDAGATDGPLVESPRAWNEHAVSFTLLPGEWIEYKFALAPGGTFLYEWAADVPVIFDMHTEPVGSAASESESFAQGESAGGRGSYRAPYSGFHGWYWQNVSDDDVELTLSAAGFFTQSREYREDGSVTDHDLRPDAAP